MVSKQPMLENITLINSNMEHADPGKILSWAWDTFGDGVVASSSFQTQSVPLLHMISLVVPQVSVLFVDTGFHFPETIRFRDQLVEMLNLNLVVVRPKIFGDAFVEVFGPLYDHNPDVCCFHNKIVPLELKLKEHQAWVTGIRRDQTAARENLPMVGKSPHLDIIKINPMAAWTSEDIHNYIEDYELPRHPLWALGFRSIGCQPCTASVLPNQRDRDGRWPDQEKQECGVLTL